MTYHNGREIRKWKNLYFYLLTFYHIEDSLYISIFSQIAMVSENINNLKKCVDIDNTL